MKAELQRKIFEKCPILFRHRHQGPEQNLMCFGIDCGSGWFDLILELSIEIETIAQRMKTEGVDESLLPYAFQIKEKYGGLNVSVHNGYPEFSHLIIAAEAQSRSVCEECGKPGILRRNDGWFSTLCDDCQLKISP